MECVFVCFCVLVALGSDSVISGRKPGRKCLLGCVHV